MAHVFLLVFSRSVFSRVYKVCSYTKSIHGNNHEKMVKESRRCCEALCTKGFRIRENSVCENRGVNAQNERKIWDFYQITALNRHIFTMSENGRLKFQRSQSQLEKVRD